MQMEHFKPGWTSFDEITLSSLPSGFLLSQWDLVCDSQPLNSVTRFLFMSGMVVGSFVFGHLTDKWVWPVHHSLFLNECIINLWVIHPLQNAHYQWPCPGTSLPPSRSPNTNGKLQPVRKGLLFNMWELCAMQNTTWHRLNTQGDLRRGHIKMVSWGPAQRLNWLILSLQVPGSHLGIHSHPGPPTPIQLPAYS